MSKSHSKNSSLWKVCATITLVVGTIGCSGGPYNNCYPYTAGGQVPVTQYPVQAGVLPPANSVMPPTATTAPTLPLGSPQSSVMPQTGVPIAGAQQLPYGIPLGTNYSQVLPQGAPQQIVPSPGVYSPAAHTAAAPFTDKSAQGLIKF